MKHCETCKWADDNGQPAGNAICRKRTPIPVAVSDGKGQVATIGMFPPVRLAFDGCGEHEEGRERIHLVPRMPSEN